MSNFYNAFKKYIVKHPQIGEYKVTSVKFNASTLRAVEEKLDSSITCTPEDISAIEQFVTFSKYLHELYEKLYEIIKDDLNHLNLEGIEIAQYVVAALNREYKVIWDKRQDAVSKATQGTYHISDMMNFKIKSSDPKIGLLDARAAMESETDCVNLILNYLRHSLNKCFTSSNSKPDEFAGRILHSIQCSQIAVVIKHSYDDILYNGGSISIDEKSKTIMFDYDNRNNLKLLMAGDLIFAERRIQTLSKAHEEGNKNQLHNYTTRYRIKKAIVSDGCIKLTFSQGNTKEFKSIIDDMQAALDGYYEFLKGNTILPAIGGCSLEEVIACWCCIQYISLNVIVNVNFDVEIHTKEDFYAVPSKILKNDLVCYINKLTGIKTSKITEIIDSMMADWEKYNDIWTSMLYPVGNYILLPFFPIIYSSPYNVIDWLLKKGGINLDARGKQFEEFLYSKLTEDSSSYPIICLPAGKYGIDRNMEEIDVLISMKNSILVADAKCIHYSVEPINYSEAWERLEEGCEQALRKADFVRQNPQYFKEFGDYSKKNIIPFVITNYPTFTGFSHNGVYVIDYMSFLSYMKSGLMTMRELSATNDTILGHKFYYKNEDEYSDRFPQYLSENPLKKIFLKRIYIGNHPLSTSKDDWTIVSKSAKLETDSQFNISN